MRLRWLWMVMDSVATLTNVSGYRLSCGKVVVLVSLLVIVSSVVD